MIEKLALGHTARKREAKVEFIFTLTSNSAIALVVIRIHLADLQLQGA